jgi:hypothetical protein
MAHEEPVAMYGVNEGISRVPRSSYANAIANQHMNINGGAQRQHSPKGSPVLSARGRVSSAAAGARAEARAGTVPRNNLYEGNPGVGGGGSALDTTTINAGNRSRAPTYAVPAIIGMAGPSSAPVDGYARASHADGRPVDPPPGGNVYDQARHVSTSRQANAVGQSSNNIYDVGVVLKRTPSTESNNFYDTMVDAAAIPHGLVLVSDDDAPNYEVIASRPTSPGGHSFVLKHFSDEIGGETASTRV